MKISLFLAALTLVLAPRFALSAQEIEKTTPELILQAGHGEYPSNINAIACSPDGRLLAAAANREVRLYDLQNGDLVRCLTGLRDRVFSVSFSPDGNSVVCGGGQVLVWDVKTGHLRHSLDLPGWNFRQATFWPDDDTVTTTVSGGGLQMWDVVSGKTKRTILEGKIYGSSLGGVALSPDGNLVAGEKVWRDRFFTHHRILISDIDVWDVKAKRKVANWTQRGSARGLAFSASSTLLAGISSDSFYVRKIPSGELLWEMPSSNARKVAFAPDGKSLVVCGDGMALEIREATTGKVLHQLSKERYWGASVAISEDFIVVTNPQEVYIWDAKTYALKRKWFHLMLPVKAQFIGKSEQFFSLTDKAQIIEGVTVRQNVGDRYNGWLSFSPDGDLVVAASSLWPYKETKKLWDAPFTLWDTKTWKPMRGLQDSAWRFSAMAWSPDSKLIAGGGITESNLRIWRASDGKTIRDLVMIGSTSDLAFSPDGKTLAAAIFDNNPATRGHVVRLWDVATWRVKKEFRHPDQWNVPLHIAFAPQENTLAISNAFGGVRGWNCQSGQLLWETKAHKSEVKQILFSPDGRILASGGEDGRIIFMDANSGKILHSLEAHTSTILSLDFSHDGRILLSGGADGTLRFWDVNGVKLLLTRCVLIGNGHSTNEPERVWIAFTPEGYYDGSPDIETSLRWRVGDALFAGELYKARFYQPSLVRRALNDAHKASYRIP